MYIQLCRAVTLYTCTCTCNLVSGIYMYMCSTPVYKATHLYKTKSINYITLCKLPSKYNTHSTPGLSSTMSCNFNTLRTHNMCIVFYFLHAHNQNQAYCAILYTATCMRTSASTGYQPHKQDCIHIASLFLTTDPKLCPASCAKVSVVTALGTLWP